MKSIPWARLHPSPAPSQFWHPPELQPGAGSAPSPLRPPREQQPDPAPAIPAGSQRVPLPPVLGIPAAEANGAVSAGLALPVFLPRALPWLLAIPNARDNLLMHGWCGWSRIMGASSPRRSRGDLAPLERPGWRHVLVPGSGIGLSRLRHGPGGQQGPGEEGMGVGHPRGGSASPLPAALPWLSLSAAPGSCGSSHFPGAGGTGEVGEELGIKKRGKRKEGEMAKVSSWG